MNKSDIISFFHACGFGRPPTPSASAVAKQQLEEARLQLLEKQKEKESAICAVDILQMRIRRLEAQTKESI